MPFPRFLRPLGVTAVLLGLGLPAAEARDAFSGAYLAAREANRVGDYPAVVSYGTEALVRDPENIGLMEGLILAHLALGQIDTGAPIARRLTALDADNDIAALILLADAMGRADWPAVVGLLDGGASVGAAVDRMIRAWAAIGAGQMSAAVEIFDALAADPGVGASALFQKGLALALVGDYEGAARIFSGEDQVLQLSTGGILTYAQILSQLERNTDALGLLDAAFAGSEDPEVVALRADLEAGKAVAFTAIDSPRDGLAALFFDIGQSMRGETDPALVLIYARIAAHLDPGNTGALLTIAQVFEEMENFSLAAEAYGQIDRGDRAYPQAQLGRATALRRMGEAEAGIEVLRALAADQGDIAAVHVALGDALRIEGRYGEALTHYDDALALYGAPQPGHWGVYFARGVSRSQTDDWEGAVADFRQALALNPDQPSVLNFLGYGFVEKRTNLDEALAMIRRAVAARPFDGAIRDSLGWVYYRLGRYEEAVVEMERAIELEPIDPILNDHLGDVYWAVGRKREAEFQWRRALSFIDKGTSLEEIDPDRVRRKLEVGLDVVLEEEGGEALQK